MHSSTAYILLSKRMIFSLVGLFVILHFTMSQPLYSSSVDNIQIIKDLRTLQANMEAQITKMIKEQNSKLLQIEKKMQSDLANLENRVKNITKDMARKSCPSNWTSFGCSCYNIIAQEKSWDNANMECKQFGAKLVEIETKEENDFLKQRISIYDDESLSYHEYKKFWIGGTDRNREGSFFWASTGSSLTFTDWDRGEPNDEDSVEDCIEISTFQTRTGTWNDNNCALKYHYICEKSC